MPADPWGNFAPEPGDVATMAAERPVSPRLESALAVLPQAEPDVDMPMRRYLANMVAPLTQASDAALNLYAMLTGRRVTSTHLGNLRRRVSDTVSYWITGKLSPHVIHLGDHTRNVRQAVRDDNRPVVAEDVRRWAEAMQASVLAGGLVQLEEVNRG